MRQNLRKKGRCLSYLREKHPHLEPKPACGLAGRGLPFNQFLFFPSFKQPEQMIKLAALPFCSEKPECIPTLSCNLPSGGGKVGGRMWWAKGTSLHSISSPCLFLQTPPSKPAYLATPPHLPLVTHLQLTIYPLVVTFRAQLWLKIK